MIMNEAVKDLNASQPIPVLNDLARPEQASIVDIIAQPLSSVASFVALEDAKTPSPDAKAEPPKAPFSQLFYFVEGGEKWLVAVASFFACLQGLGMPIFSFIFGGMADTFSNSDPDAIADQMNNRPRATHAFASPLQVFSKLLANGGHPSTPLH